MLSNTTFGTLMASLDVNIVLIALPTIGRELPGTSALDLIWILIGYQLVISALLVNLGRISDIFGRVRLYSLGFAVFTVGSALSGLAQSGQQLVAFRMVQGLGAAFLFSNSAALITDAFPIEERGRALGINGVSVVVGSVVGLLLGGFLTSEAGWRSVFFVNVPIGVFATVQSHLRLRELAKIKKGERIDIPGNVTFAAGLALVLAAVTLYALALLDFWLLVLLGGAGAVLLVAFVAIERRIRAPMLDLSLFTSRGFSAGNLATLLYSLARGVVTLVIVLYLQGPSMNFDPLTAGLYLIPISASTAVVGPISGWLSDKYGVRPFATAGLVLCALGYVALTGLGATVTFEGLALPLLLIGSGVGLFTPPNRASVMNSVPPEARGVAAGVNTTLNNVGLTFSRGFAFLVMGLFLPIGDLQYLFSGESGAGGVSWVGEFVSSLHLIFYLSAFFVALAIIPSLLRGAAGKEEGLGGDDDKHPFTAAAVPEGANRPTNLPPTLKSARGPELDS